MAAVAFAFAAVAALELHFVVVCDAAAAAVAVDVTTPPGTPTRSVSSRLCPFSCAVPLLFIETLLIAPFSSRSMLLAVTSRDCTHTGKKKY